MNYKSINITNNLKEICIFLLNCSGQIWVNKSEAKIMHLIDEYYHPHDQETIIP